MTSRLRTKRARLIMVAVLLAGVCTFLLLWDKHQPSYQGRTLRSWLEEFPMTMDPAGNSMVPFPPEMQKAVERAGEAIRMMGDDALPLLDSELGLVSGRRERFEYQVFSITSRLYKYTHYEYHYTPVYVRRCRAVSAIAELRSKAQSFLPTLKRISEDEKESPIVRHQTRTALEKLAGSSTTVPSAK